MKLYALFTSADANGSVIDLRDNQGRLAGYFIWDRDDGKFLWFVIPRGKAQKPLTADRISATDYLEANIGIPIFSDRARRALAAALAGDAHFHELTVEAEGAEFTFYMCKILARRAVIDQLRTQFRPLADGTRMITRPVYTADPIEPFLLARDTDYPEYFVASEAFMTLCGEHNLSIECVERPSFVKP